MSALPAVSASPAFRRLALLLAATLMAAMAFSAAARAEPVQEFGFQIKDIAPGGAYTIVFRANSFDTTGAPPPLVTENNLRLAAGVTIRPEFLKKDYQCNVEHVRDALLAREPGRPYTQRLENLAATLKRTRKTIRPGLAPGVETCIRAQVGRGSVLADARPSFVDPAPANLFIYLAKPTVKGAKAALGVLVVLDEKSVFFKNNPFLQTLRLTFTVNIFDEPTPDGLYGYKLVLPGGGAAGVRVSLAEIQVTTPGLSQVKKTVTCLKKRKGKCVKKKVTTKKTFWLTQPACPTTGQLGFEAFYKYETGATTTKTGQIPCPLFKL